MSVENPTPGLTGGTTAAPAGHDEAMAAKFDKSQADALAESGAGAATETPTTPTTRPEGVPEKFWDASTGQVKTEALLKSYTDLEKKATAPAEVKNPADPNLAIEAKSDATTEAAKEAVGAEAFSEYSKEFAEKGELSEDTFKALEAKGIPKSLVEQYIEGTKAIAATARAEGLATAGGEEAYSKMSEWAAKNMAAADLDAYNKAVELGNSAERKQAIVALKARYEAAYGSDQSGLVNGDGKTSNVLGYESSAQMTADMKDPRYGKDAAFRKMVEARLNVTTAF